ncbi:MAG TPA: protein-disulfide reductase DsbD domain-containing protein [Verrucomicrobiae bacterium]|nr:protein-disulfide reductase DsbD domain-containing protein [Verrucomicrobiae bacterium]
MITWLAPSAHAAATDVSLLLSADTARPGDTITAGIHLKMKPGWHTYWRNPGGSGMATTIAWQLPTGITAGAVEWPVPEKLPAADLTTYVYENEVVLLVPLKIATNAPAGPLDLKAKVSWLECSTECVLGSGKVQGLVTIGSELKPSADAGTIAMWQAKLPLNQPGLAARAWWEKPAKDDLRPVVLEWPSVTNGHDADFLPYTSDKFEVQATNEFLTTNTNKIRLRKMVKKFEGDWPSQISGVLLQQTGDGLLAYEVTLPIAADANLSTVSATPASANNSAAQPPVKSLGLMLLYAFLGGLILNIFPCVLPVIALKILGFVNQGRDHPGQVRKLGLIYACGVLFSFLVLAALVIGIKLAGHQAGWGLQFGNPVFLVIMTVLVTLVALNLFGLFEVNLSGRVMGAAGDLSAREGNAGAFFNGVLATILATPCSAPFLGIALGFAFTQPAAIIILIFLTIGVGLSAPYVILSFNPALLKLLPKPGAWMEKFKIAMGFPMLATAFWLYDLTTVHYGDRVLWLAFFLVMVALCAWIYGEFIQRGRSRKGLAAIVIVVILTSGYFYALEDNLKWRTPIIETAATTSLSTDPDAIVWQPWSAKAVADATAAGHPVLVDFTAQWCTVCQINSRTSIKIASVRKKLKDIHAVALKGDYTRLPEDITVELGRFGRGAVPLVLVYPGNPAAAPEVLPDGFLTPTIVLDALDKAAKQTPANVASAN